MRQRSPPSHLSTWLGRPPSLLVGAGRVPPPADQRRADALSAAAVRQAEGWLAVQKRYFGDSVGGVCSCRHPAPRAMAQDEAVAVRVGNGDPRALPVGGRVPARRRHSLADLGSGWRSTTSAPATRRWPTYAAFRSTSQDRPGASSRVWAGTRRTRSSSRCGRDGRRAGPDPDPRGHRDRDAGAPARGAASHRATTSGGHRPGSSSVATRSVRCADRRSLRRRAVRRRRS
jgi:hypothetical protein